MERTYYTEDGVFVRETEKAIVRIHSGKLTEEQRKAVIINAAKDFYKAIQRANQQKAISQ